MTCFDCSALNNELYMVNDGIWNSVGMPSSNLIGLLWKNHIEIAMTLPGEGYYLCLNCLERRLGRILTIDDFKPDIPANQGIDQVLINRQKERPIEFIRL
jgi:hypothetical protein